MDSPSQSSAQPERAHTITVQHGQDALTLRALNMMEVSYLLERYSGEIEEAVVSFGPNLASPNPITAGLAQTAIIGRLYLVFSHAIAMATDRPTEIYAIGLLPSSVWMECFGAILKLTTDEGALQRALLMVNQAAANASESLQQAALEVQQAADAAGIVRH